MNISKELLSEVLGCNIKDIYKINSNPNFGNNELVYSISGVGDILSINIYELAHKCKEWAIKKGYQFKVYYQADGTEEWEIGLAGYGWYLFIAKNCVEACQWILENK